MSKKKTVLWKDRTPAQRFSFIKAALRAGTIRFPPRYEVLNAAKRGKQINQETGRVAEHYQCAQCLGLFPAKLVVTDHIEPVVPVTGFTSWDDIVSRMFCDTDGLQVLCKPCHKLKTQAENLERKLHKTK
ncbi:MAG: HNH nuclease [Caudoviricetes sp.]|nr:MAG: HNH nuclease [Caudoviricetes sp.]